ncbi:MAG: hypothetical protein HOW73_01890 [Polyangiaceae bacterium]|nr:hypothetical protein [Polyangiaceae bacterium]
MKRPLVFVAAALGLLSAAMFIPVRPDAAQSTPSATATPMSLDEHSADKPARPLNVLFIHHSCGGQLLAAEGAEKGANCIYDSHPSGGSLRDKLTAQGYTIHEASYGSDIGEDTDMFDWVGKFGTKMDKILSLKKQDELLPAGEKNQIVVFKSCFPNNQFVGEGAVPGDAAGPQLTVENAKASLNALLPLFEKQPNTLFVYVTAPPVAPKPEPLRLYRVLARLLKGRSEPEWTAKQASWARSFNSWVVSTDGWLKGYEKKNVVVFDYYDVLTGHGKSNLSVYATGNDDDSHPSAEGNSLAADAFVPFINRAARRSGLIPGPTAAN